MFKLLPSGNIEMTVQLTPEAYAALKDVGDTEQVAHVDLVNMGIMVAYEAVKIGRACGRPLYVKGEPQ